MNLIKKINSIFNNNEIENDERIKLVNDFHILTDKIHNLESCYQQCEVNDGEALLDGISMYTKMQSNILKRIKIIDERRKMHG